MTLTSCILFWSYINAIDPAVTKAVISVESNGNQFAVGKTQDSGLMQIRHNLVPESQLQLFSSCTNVMRGTFLLAQAKKKCKHTIDRTWIICYNRGLTGGRKTRYPKNTNYYKKIITLL
jgi:soluble lytic murein transglycosylase-like protein